MKNNNRNDDCHAHDTYDPEGRYQESHPAAPESFSRRRDPDGRYQTASNESWPASPFIHYQHPEWCSIQSYAVGPLMFSKGCQWIKVDGAGNIIDRGINNNFRGEF